MKRFLLLNLLLFAVFLLTGQARQPGYAPSHTPHDSTATPANSARHDGAPPITGNVRSDEAQAAEGEAEDRRIALLKRMAGFDHEFPREKAYLHLDNNAYLEDDTLWFKAYVVRADLRPTTLSRVLYVDWLNADGQLMEQKLIRLDSLGQGDGMIALNLPIKNGFYEIRAYTREMMNWGEAACFSRVVPVFARPDEAGQFADLHISRPEMEDDLVAHHERPWTFHKSSSRRLRFFPEGGQRVSGTAGRLAYLLTDGNEAPCSDTISIYDTAGHLLLTTVPEHRGMGAFLLPADCEGGTAQVSGHTFDLPQPVGGRCALRLHNDTDSLRVFLLPARDESQVPSSGSPSLSPSGHTSPRRVCAALLCREHLRWCDTLTLGTPEVRLCLPAEVAGHGVNRLVVFDAQGRTLAERQFYHLGQPLRHARVEVRQNEACYAPFSPVALDITVADPQGKPLSVPISLSVRDAAGQLVGDGAAHMEAQWLLSSEVKGYIHRPEWYFEDPADSVRRHALDLLLMVQGWTASPVSVMTGCEPFDLRHPIEESLTLSGTVIKDIHRVKPYPGLHMSLTMFSDNGGSVKGEATTDSLGRFSFTSNTDYWGEQMGIFHLTEPESGENRWSRVMLDRWHGPRPRPFHPSELAPESPRLPQAAAQGQAAPPPDSVLLFQWKDTLSRTPQYLLREAKVVDKKGRRYKGLNFNRYTYGGGEKKGFRHGEFYWNVPLELERAKDKGMSFYSMYDFFAYLFDRSELAYDNSHFDPSAKPETTEEGEEHTPRDDDGAWVEELEGLRYRNRPVLTEVNNGSGAVGGEGMNTAPEEVKSCMLTTHYIKPGSNMKPGDGYLFIYTSPDWHKWREKRGYTKRHIWGYAVPQAFPRLNYYELPATNPADFRRTLYWAPSLHTDASGHANAIFFSNAREGQQLSISLCGITPEGDIISYER